MNNNKLVLLDSIVGLVLLPMCLFFRGLHKLFAYFTSPRYEKILIIKFLGAGNLIAIKDILFENSADIVTARSNLLALNTFGVGQKILVIDDRGILPLVMSSMSAIIRLIFSRYDQVINLETESKFAKFMTSITSARIISGVSNINKSYIDYFLYDRYLVSPLALDKSEVVSQLLKFSASTNKNIEHALDFHRLDFLEKVSLKKISTVVLSPSCSNTDRYRRLSMDGWGRIVALLSSQGISTIRVVFPSLDDEQYLAFVELRTKIPGLLISITDYYSFVTAIKNCDLLVTVDSQALHIAQLFFRTTVAIYGPTSPFGVSLCATTFPMTLSLNCSPCTHKYLKLPCKGTIPCMNFNDDHMSIFRSINA